MRLLPLLLLTAIPCAAQTMMEGQYFTPEHVRAAHIREATLRSLDTLGPDGRGMIFWHAVFNDQGDPIYVGTMRAGYTQGGESLGPRFRVSDPLATYYRYDTAGQLIRSFSLAGDAVTVITWRYDASGRETDRPYEYHEVRLPVVDDGVPPYIPAYEDTVCQSELISDRTETDAFRTIRRTRYVLDSKGRPTERLTSYDGESSLRRECFRYDQRDSVVDHITIDDRDTTDRVVSIFDEAGRLMRRVEGVDEGRSVSANFSQQIWTITYDSAGSVRVGSFPRSSFSVRWRLDSSGNLTDLTTQYSDTVLWREAWRYDSRGLPTEGEIRFHRKYVPVMKEGQRKGPDGKMNTYSYEAWRAEVDPSPKPDRYRYEYVIAPSTPESGGRSPRTNIK